MREETAKRLYELRREHGYTQEELAEKLGVSRQAVSKWERQEASPDTDNLIALARLYGISVDELLGYTPENKTQSGEKEKEEPKKDYVHVSFKGIHVEDGDDSVHISWKDGVHVENKNTSVHMNKDDENMFANGHLYNVREIKRKAKGRAVFTAVFVTVISVAFLLMGLNLGLWHPAWMLFLLIPIVESLITAVQTKNAHAFAFPVLAATVYLALGFAIGWWAWGWLIFLLIPFYYLIFRDKKGEE